MIQGVIFDMDGLMFDTERIWATLWEPALAGLGLSYKEGLDEAARGTAGDSMRAVLRRFYGRTATPTASSRPCMSRVRRPFWPRRPKSPAWTSCWPGWSSGTSPWWWPLPAVWPPSGIIWTAGA